MMATTRLWMLGVLLAGSGAAAGWLAWPERAPAPLPAPAARPAAAPAMPSPTAPSFDVTRVGQSGDAVVAGRAAPGDEVTLRAGERELGRVRADARGEWVILPPEPLPPGTHALSLSARSAAGTPQPGGEAVVVVVPERPGTAAGPAAAAEPPAQPLALLLPGQGAPSRLMQGSEAGRAARLGLEVVEYDEEGALRFAGTAPPGSTVRLYVDQAHAGDVTADSEGRWGLQPAPPGPKPGQHMLRLDQLSAGGGVAARRELPFMREANGGPIRPGEVLVRPGNSLWRIARANYGRGTRYTIIYRANRSQIRDPGRIYPGQILALPPR
ncbi:LysM peptidoglycan-binding domain-containing protein [Pseudoroseomonas oryzae]|uniref:LysM peptidoglycan-binding domain-containing protein n=2 Tax=Teichococcus oryzae TaxID=1608942 RepID=A0A5B2TH48_9PROT|nr:LysM peptidoglycan-binding domain-containing protein [Pseudoroseomonas oryzae]